MPRFRCRPAEPVPVRLKSQRYPREFVDNCSRQGYPNKEAHTTIMVPPAELANLALVFPLPFICPRNQRCFEREGKGSVRCAVGGARHAVCPSWFELPRPNNLWDILRIYFQSSTDLGDFPGADRTEAHRAILCWSATPQQRTVAVS